MGRNKLSIDFGAFEHYANEIEKMGGDLKQVVDAALTSAASTVGSDTLEGVQPGNLPAKGRYSRGKTAETVVTSPKVEWTGNVASVGLGFDKSRPGAGGFLITGTPRMAPAPKLAQIYSRKTYSKKLMLELDKMFADALRKLGG